jgi:hypothetical protein
MKDEREREINILCDNKGKQGKTIEDIKENKREREER